MNDSFDKYALLEHDYQTLLATSLDGIVICDMQGKIITVNDVYCQMSGYSEKELLNMSIQELEVLETPEITKVHIESIIHNGTDLFESVHRTKQGEHIYVQISVTYVPSDGGKLISFMRNITERIHFENELQIASSVFAHSTDAIVITDKANTIVTVNATFEKLLGYTKAEVIGKNPKMFSSGWGNKDFYKAMWQELDANGVWKGEIVDRRKSGETYFADETIIAVKNSEGVLTNYIGISRDVTEVKERNETIKQYAYFDMLTGLPNRRLFEQEVNSHIATSRYYDQQFALFFLDLDNFKWINDSLGHHLGDKVLIHVSTMIRSLLGEGSVFSRLGGDEFVIFKPFKNILKVSQLASKILDTLKYPITVEGHELNIGWSIGVSLYPSNGASYEELLKNADIAMYEAKSKGKNTFQFFNDEMNLAASKRLEIDTRLRHAVEHCEFFLVYQPKVTCESQELRGFEVLIRWNDNKLGFVPPDLFIPIAEQSGYIYDIGLWVIKKALEDFPLLYAAKGDACHLAINVSAKQLEDRRFFDDVSKLLKSSNIPAHYLEFEITETSVMKSIDSIIPILEKIRSLGIRFSIDDFGTGYSSLRYLKKLPVNILKIDREFIRDIAINEEDKTIVQATIVMAKALKLTTIAEGVEEAEHVEILKKMGCDLYQGYYYSKPLPLEELIHA